MYTPAKQAKAIAMSVAGEGPWLSSKKPFREARTITWNMQSKHH